ncbi:MAG: GHKL domain-containing protein [Ruminococcaceae bacterium]|nr:GHKL domain-containing protein [Oscillospiraceae bacterium]
MTIYKIADILTCIFEAIMMFILLETFCVRKEHLSKAIYVIARFILAGCIYLSNVALNFSMLNMVAMAFFVFLASFLYTSNMKTRIFTAVVGLLLLAVIEIIVLFLLTALYRVTVSEIVNTPSYRLLGMIVSKMLTFAVIEGVHVWMRGRTGRMGTAFWFLFVLIFAGAHLAVFLIFRLSFHLEEGYLYNLSILCAFALLFSTFFSLYLYESVARQSEEIYQHRQFAEHMKSQEKHLNEIMLAQTQMKKFRHDIGQHFTVLSGYLYENDCCSALEYMEKLRKTVIGTRDGSIKTGNIALDAILNTKKAMAENKGIAFIYNIQMPENISMDATDICIIFGNALDNAIEACEKVATREKKIEMTLLYDNETVFCKIINTAISSKKFLETIKADKKNHGFGVQNIKEALLKYNGIPEFEQSDTEFSIKFTICL